ncbi:DUF4189 domain-containing protein [Mycobacterium lacus]|uniref:DUF4189 domain-containing protein n=1 Tax=Mycobacterium lacus TaxID=169765 RepID=A0A1X1XWY5_9MYCO|nr:DUF4189 domain-containing protein [Mycobacterium lacus]MCV7125095.1 DUF4189 domain-containing protein [Mycobacterium lacus]ORW03294.1 hypothetical protein AWC15_05605 [Mycobacterium lacus]BBX97679.1 hypothetical protein MLAC_29730 [Mycobacterium lacus]
MTKLRRRTVLVVACLGAAAGLTTLLVTPVGAYMDNRTMSEIMMSDMMPELPVPPVIHHGAIAVAPNGAIGKSWHQRSKARAVEVALEQCGVRSCKVLSHFTRCGAVAYDGSKYHGGAGLTRGAAEIDAVSRLGGGWVVEWACN